MRNTVFSPSQSPTDLVKHLASRSLLQQSWIAPSKTSARSSYEAVTNDFALRAGTWKTIPLESNNAVAIRNSAIKVLETVEKMDPEAIQTIDMERPSNISSAPDVAQTTYRASEHTPFEQALVHLLGVQIAQSTTHVQQNNDENAA